MFDLSEIEKLSNTPTDNDVDFDDYPEPTDFVAPLLYGSYSGCVASVDDVKEVGPVLMAELTYEVCGGPSDGRPLKFQRISNRTFQRSGRAASTMGDLFYVTDLTPQPTTNQDRARALLSLAERRQMFSFRYDWRGFCTECYGTRLREITEADTIEEARNLATSADKKEAAAFATKAKSHRGFPEAKDGSRVPSLICNDCGSEVRAQGNVVTMLKMNNHQSA
jgi:hypothetical protein